MYGSVLDQIGPVQTDKIEEREEKERKREGGEGEEERERKRKRGPPMAVGGYRHSF